MIEINKLNDKVQEIQDDLKNVKEMVLDEGKREEKIREIKEKAKVVKEERESKITTLKDKTKEEAQSLLSSLNEIINFKFSIWGNNKTWDENIQWEPSDERWFLDGTKDWIWEQRWDVWDKGKREKEWWKNLLRSVWFIATWVWAVALVSKWVKKLWNGIF